MPKLAALIVVASACSSRGGSSANDDAGSGEGGVDVPAQVGADVAAERAADVAEDHRGDLAEAFAADVAMDVAAEPISDQGGGVETHSTAAGTIVPLYTFPSDPSWADLVTARKAHPTVRVVAIVNPNSGPGASRNDSFTTGIAKLVAADVQVIGYVATGYTARGVAAVEADVDRWKTFYPQIEGIFFDEQSNKAADVAFYKTVSQYAKAAGLSYTVGNPGTDTAEAYVGALDTMLIYESKGLPALSALGGWHAKYAPDNFGVIPYGASFDVAFVSAARKSVGYVYIQNDDLPNPWDTLPPFFGDLLGALE